ncbi:hypothetical protein SETIT_3G258800v2 [Setaria italica]|uniref:Uncharacterized protein n=1 Tax=Setaria italica TaxID=4555 RepID=A0A368QJL0_SETIT|nr:hypothetical protein SETIT_3G258800v2 [Setaria italica]
MEKPIEKKTRTPWIGERGGRKKIRGAGYQGIQTGPGCTASYFQLGRLHQIGSRVIKSISARVNKSCSNNQHDQIGYTPIYYPHLAACY